MDGNDFLFMDEMAKSKRIDNRAEKRAVTSSFHATALKREEGKLEQSSTIEAWQARAKHFKQQRQRSAAGKKEKVNSSAERSPGRFVSN